MKYNWEASLFKKDERRQGKCLFFTLRLSAFIQAKEKIKEK